MVGESLQHEGYGIRKVENHCSTLKTGGKQGEGEQTSVIVPLEKDDSDLCC